MTDKPWNEQIRLFGQEYNVHNGPEKVKAIRAAVRRIKDSGHEPRFLILDLDHMAALYWVRGKIGDILERMITLDECKVLVDQGIDPRGFPCQPLLEWSLEPKFLKCKIIVYPVPDRVVCLPGFSGQLLLSRPGGPR